MAETGPQRQPDEAMVDLLVKQITEGLSAAEQRELDAMDNAAVRDIQLGLERAAAAASLAGLDNQALPPDLLARLVARGEQFVTDDAVGEAAARQTSALSETSATTGRRIAATPAAVPVPLREPRRNSPWGWLAAAACLLLAAVGWLRPQSAQPPTANVELSVPKVIVRPLPEATPAKPPTPEEERDAMLASAEATKVTLGPTKDPAAAGVTADAVWDPKTQKGFLHFTGLAANDPQARQYQMWIFDAARDKKYPVDAGLFDVPAGATEVVIPLRAALPIGMAAAFAVTVETPGGVVVSALKHVVALGKVAG